MGPGAILENQKSGGWNPITLSPNAKDAQSDGWTRYNFTGYEGRDAYGEYKALIDQMKTLGADSAHGCGRALWENNGDNGQYGTTMALMLLPHWTNGCIDSMEGLFFEASGTQSSPGINASRQGSDRLAITLSIYALSPAASSTTLSQL